MEIINEVQTLNSDYFEWLRNREVLRSIDDQWVEISTPFLDRHNDCLDIYVKRVDKNNFMMTDDGYIISDLLICGFDINTPKRRSILREILSGSRVRCVNDRLEISFSHSEFSQSKHSLIQAMISVNDMFYSTVQYRTSFSEDLAGWLDACGVCYVQKVCFQGKTGMFHKFFGVIPKSKERPERFLEPINNPDGNSVKCLLFEWEDTRDERPPGAVLLPVLNDSDKKIKAEYEHAFESFGISCMRWTKRDSFKKQLIG